jgi:TIR domain
VADIFVSYTSSDRDWAFWIGQQLEKFGHVAHIHEWEIDGGGNIPAWMQERQDKADHTLCVISSAYLSRPYSSWELQAAQWAAASDRPNFMLPVFVEDCKAPTMLAPFKRCDLFGLNETDARARLEAYLKPAARPSDSAQFPGGGEKAPLRHPEVAVFPGIQRQPSSRDPTPAKINDDMKRAEGETSQTVKGASSLLRAGSMSQLILIVVLAICALGVIAWLLSSSGSSVKTGNCSIANSGTATGNAVNCGPPPTAPAAKP